MAKIRLLVLDVLKLHKPSIIEFGQDILKGQKGLSLNITVEEVDERTETVQIVIKGDNIKYHKVKEVIELQGASIHSIDEVCIGAQVIGSNHYRE